MHGKYGKAHKLSRKMIRGAIEVHREKGPGLIESIYENCLIRELKLRSIPAVNQLVAPIEYNNFRLREPLQLGVSVDECPILELMAIQLVLPIYKGQLLNSMKLFGMLINFHEIARKDGIHRNIFEGADR